MFTKGEWKVDVRVGCVAVYADNEKTQSYLPCIPDPSVCIYYKSGYQKKNKKTGFTEWNVRSEDVANANLIAAAPDMYNELKEADRTICLLCQTINPQHQCRDGYTGCTLCDERKVRLAALARAEGKDAKKSI